MAALFCLFLNLSGLDANARIESFFDGAEHVASFNSSLAHRTCRSLHLSRRKSSIVHPIQALPWGAIT